MQEASLSSNRNGLFVCVDGPSGVGKTSIVKHLSQKCEADGAKVHVTAEPSDGPIGTVARNLTESVRGAALACLYAADRYHHVETEVLPHLCNGEIVITDRYIPSALVMQRFDEVPLSFLWEINSLVKRPDLVVLLECRADIIAQRLTYRGPHNRLQMIPGSSDFEVNFFRQAGECLTEAGFRVLHVECSNNTPEEAATIICNNLPRVWRHQAIRE